MQKRTGIKLLAGFGGCLGIAIALWMAFGPDEIRLTKDRIQSLVTEQLPFHKDDVTVSDAIIEFENDQVVVNVDVEGERLGQAFSFSALTVGIPSYRTGSFYFVPSTLEFENIVINDNDEESISKRLQGAVNRYFPDNEGARNLIEDLTPGVETWLRQRTMSAAETVLSKVPVYTLPNDSKGIAAKAVLGEVFVEQNELVITFTLWRLTWWVLMAGLFALMSIGMMAALIRNPTLFAAVSLFPTDM